MSDSLFRRTPVPVRLGAALGVALLAAACGSSASSSSSPATSAPPATGTPAAVSTATSSATAMVISTKSSSAGKFLVNGAGRAIYLWVKDAKDQSMCTGACASAWPPVTTTGPVTGSGGVLTGDLGTITRAGGVKQVTYDGHPLYYYVGDTGAGTVNGQGSTGFGAYWWLVAPTGSAITSSVKLTGASTSTGSGSGGTSGGSGGGW
jgi:predicted lipoprotein with Yx(FWY)xxD motif